MYFEFTFEEEFLSHSLVLEDEGTTTTLLNVRTLLIQRDTVTFPNTRIFTHNNKQFVAIHEGILLMTMYCYLYVQRRLTCQC